MILNPVPFRSAVKLSVVSLVLAKLGLTACRIECAEHSVLMQTAADDRGYKCRTEPCKGTFGKKVE